MHSRLQDSADHRQDERDLRHQAGAEGTDCNPVDRDIRRRDGASKAQSGTVESDAIPSAGEGDHSRRLPEVDAGQRIPRAAAIGVPVLPVHSDHEWQRIKEGDPDEWQYVIDFEKRLQEVTSRCETLRSMPFLHPSLVPIDQVVLKPKKAASGDKQVTMHEMWNDIKNECDGMCGI